MILERLKNYIDYKGISVFAFEKSIGMANSSFRKCLKNGGAIGTDKLENILRIYTDINIVWLITGVGEMIAPEGTAPRLNRARPSDSPTLIAMLREKDNTIKELAEEVGRLKERLATLQREKNGLPVASTVTKVDHAKENAR